MTLAPRAHIMQSAIARAFLYKVAVAEIIEAMVTGAATRAPANSI